MIIFYFFRNFQGTKNGFPKKYDYVVVDLEVIDS